MQLAGPDADNHNYFYGGQAYVCPFVENHSKEKEIYLYA